MQHYLFLPQREDYGLQTHHISTKANSFIKTITTFSDLYCSSRQISKWSRSVSLITVLTKIIIIVLYFSQRFKTGISLIQGVPNGLCQNSKVSIEVKAVENHI